MSGPLQGVRIWLVGSVPRDESVSEASRESIRTFVQQFAEQAFRAGAHIIHGSHPTFVPMLLAAAKKHVDAGGRHDCLTLVVSRLWSKDPGKVPVEEWRKTCAVYETPENEGPDARDKSLESLRLWMVARSDACVAVGGEPWPAVVGKAGVPVELKMAVESGLPSFVAAALGGAAATHLQEYPETLRALRNGLSSQENQALADNTMPGPLAERIAEQLTRLPLVRGRVSDGPAFRILAIDGGGIKGTFPAAVIATLEHALGRSAIGHFDLIAGTSTGGIIAIALGLGLTGKEILDFYTSRGATIFPVTSLHAQMLRKLVHMVAPKYAREVLLRELRAAYYRGQPGKTFADAKCRLVIPAYNLPAGTPHVFRTPHHPLLRSDATTDLALAALATAAAPTYFPAARLADLVAETQYVDGGVWANSPAMAGIVEAVCYLNVPLDRIDVLSVGTTTEPFSPTDKGNSGVIGWGKTTIDLFMNAQAEAAVRHARQLVGEPRFLRINAVARPGQFALDDPTSIGDLAALGRAHASDVVILGQVKSRFLNGVPVHDWKL